jgi:hypothetical protein
MTPCSLVGWYKHFGGTFYREDGVSLVSRNVGSDLPHVQGITVLQYESSLHVAMSISYADDVKSARKI